MKIDDWLTAANRLLERLRQIELGYPIDENIILPPNPDAYLALASVLSLGETPSLADLWRRCDGISWPDVHHGYFILSCAQMTNAIRIGEPLKISGSLASNIVPFGADGSGARFALRIPSNDVIYIPNSTRTFEGAFDGALTPARYLAPTLMDFLTALLEIVTK